ncbi:hypothetical protein RV11_GL003014 [Enterococcus phoeniculicola]|jgi:hypothetical protein|uniref:DUF4064 domain-containing protein n=1 Tax=Enterococcus phoeniculicola ATCC BAA-412 TaxID=1158610 RepID=R3WLD9_9ENTE|nr:hypothetical protein [Enterococcus phoeniculicola]EOL42690.1 hypothetical protein UC3_03043 [Enterococcus phoeniculicola ATCC BAA-412]EOT79026.1 hypothetical protein I589_00533 [Enterococcus phoeniculicola ATCC BAA-412]OJG72432.1 hypothetical protein RV11_GL003014 [Enterococcus phoeniculicola]
MKLGFYKSITILNSLQVFLYLLAFISWAQNSVGDTPFLAIYEWNLFSILFWSVVSVIGITGLVFSIYTLLAIKPKKNTGIILSIVGYAGSLFFLFFLIVPTTILVLGAVFTYLLNIKETTEID